MRDFVRSVEINDVGATGRTIEGSALTWNRAYRVSDDGGKSYYLEGWRPGSFRDGLKIRPHAELRPNHLDVRIGSVAFAEAARTLDFTASVEPGELGDALLAHVDAGDVSQVSLRFESDRQVTKDGVVWRLRALPRELSLVVGGDRAQYDDALILARRSLTAEADPQELAIAAARAARTEVLLARSRELLALGVRLG